MRKILVIASMFWGSKQAFAADSATVTGNLLSWLLSSLFVVALILVLAFMVKKTRLKFGQGGHIKMLSALSVGPKEKVILVEVQNRRFLLGVASGNVRLLSELNSGDDFKDVLQHAELCTKTSAKALKTESDDESLKR